MSLIFSQRLHHHHRPSSPAPPAPAPPPPPPLSLLHNNNNNNNISSSSSSSTSSPSPSLSSSSSTTARQVFDQTNNPPYNYDFNFSYSLQNNNNNNNNHPLRMHPNLLPLHHHGIESHMPWNYNRQPPTTTTYSNTTNPNATTAASHHQRASSNSSIGSAGPSTPYNGHTSPLVSVPQEYYDGLPHPDHLSSSYSIFQKPLPTPIHTPLHTPLRDLFPEYQSYSPHAVDSDPSSATTTSIMEAQQHKTRGQQQQQQQQQAHPSEQETAQAPESSDDFESRRKSHYHAQVPKLDRTISDLFADELYNPSYAPSAAPLQTPTTRTTAASSPSHAQSLMAQRLQTANSHHLSAPTQYPMVNIPRDRSPFRQGSPLAPSPNAATTFHIAPLSAAKVRKQEKAENDAKMLAEQLRKHSPGHDAQQQTISPKDAMLEYSASEEDANMPLFAPAHHAPHYPPLKVEDDAESLQSFGSMATSRRESSSAYSASSQTTAQPSGFHFTPPSLAGSAHMPQIPQQYPFVAAVAAQQTKSPEFHSPLHSMASSGSDYMPDAEHTKPAHAAADGGTYTCTYQGCTLRFDTPAKLQKHKKDGHRHAHATATTGGTSSSASPSTRGTSEGIAARNSQAGPHKCDRINPSTGKPCNTVFSRPYDLTRHEDTIHNARHQKIRCSLCTEVKTFSRNDALTRHFRVVHPEVELPGKGRRKAAV